MYISAPAGNPDKPKLELKGFSKTSLLQPGQSQTITITLTARDLSSFNTAQLAWIADAGIYQVMVGGSSTDIKLSASLNLAKAIVSEKVNDVLALKNPVNEWVHKQMNLS